uniref:N-terminal Xaa-Pro-Lys N-methyltransferase 1 n=1 Tax=Oryctolagus cuniculus TaxID=9986 RepID=A0A5F9D0R3_RABIT
MTSQVIRDEKQFYSKAEMYWKQILPTVDGMLGGYGHISSIDITSSRKFLQRFLRDGPNKTGTSYMLDCGASIGRITNQYSHVGVGIKNKTKTKTKQNKTEHLSR